MHFRSRSLSVVGDKPGVYLPRETGRGFPGRLTRIRAPIGERHLLHFLLSGVEDMAVQGVSIALSTEDVARQ
jgi:hypothetical protein